jgi:hypothetical protein
VDGPSEIS